MNNLSNRSTENLEKLQTSLAGLIELAPSRFPHDGLQLLTEYDAVRHELDRRRGAVGVSDLLHNVN